MTLLPILAALAIAAPAAAQETDIRVTEVSESSDGFSCRAQALPELRISHDWRDGGRGAGWTSQARDVGSADELRFNVAFSPSDTAPFGTASGVTGFSLQFSKPLPRPATTAHLRIDGTADPSAILLLDGDTRFLSVAVGERQRSTLAERLMRASILELDLADASGAPLRRLGWDVRKLRRAPQLLQLINWSCR